MSDLWYRTWHWLCARVYFSRIRVLYPERIPPSGPTMCVGLHRNGAVDGFVYRQAVQSATFMLSSQLRRSFFARLFFTGIEVTRDKDRRAGDDANNRSALDDCVDHLADGGELFVFPEGTSTLGPRHLPFKSGAALVALEAFTREVPLRIIPFGLHYERPWRFRSRVEIWVGEPVDTSFGSSWNDRARRRHLKRGIASALENVGTNFPDEAAQVRAESLASTARGSYAFAKKAIENAPATDLTDSWDGLATPSREALDGCEPLVWALPTLIVAGPFALAGALANFVPFAAGAWAARRFADDTNVIALWHILVGMPTFAMWFVVLCAVSGFVGGAMWLLAYLVATLLGLLALDPARRAACAVALRIRRPSGMDRALEVARRARSLGSEETVR